MTLLDAQDAADLQRRLDAALAAQTALEADNARLRRVEQDLRQAEEFSRALFAGAHAGLVIVNRGRGQVMDANAVATEILGMPEDRLIGAVAAEFPELLNRVLATEPGAVRDADRETVTGTNARGETRICLGTVTNLGSGEGELAFVSLLDVTGQKAVEAELRRSYTRLNEANQQLKLHKDQIVQSEKLASIGQLAAGVAHEINNPVGYVTSNLGTATEYAATLRTMFELHTRLAADPADAELAARIEQLRRQEDVDFILEDLAGLLAESLEGVERVAEIVQNLKSFAREDTLSMVPQDLNECVESMIRMVWNELKYKCHVERDFGELPPVPCHAGRINQVVVNMLVNAAQAMPADGGTIRVSTAVVDDAAVITIADDGCGMDEQTRKHIFDPFFTTKDVGKGTGLGLSISHGIVEDHGGRIEVDSTPGRGTTFRIHLPLQPEPAAGMIG